MTGAQWERTRLAWRRTVLAVTVVTLLTLRQALLADPVWVRALAASLAMLVWLGVLVAAHRRIRAVERGEPDAGRSPLSAAGATLALAALGLALLG